MMNDIALVILVWLALQLPLGILVGKFLKGRAS
jgi:hypothetical protein